MVIEALRDFDGDRFPVAKGELKVIRFGYDNPDFVPRAVSQIRAKHSVNWGGAIVFSDAYRVLFDGAGRFPAEIVARLPRSA
jgi:hypothetical protein